MISVYFIILYLGFNVCLASAGQVPPAQEALTLRDCIQRALADHPNLAMVDADIQQAKASVTGARAGVVPKVSIEAGSEYTHLGGTSSELIGLYANEVHSLGFRLNQNLFDGGKWWNGFARADRELDRVQLHKKATQHEIALGVIEAFYQLLTQLEQLEVLGKSLNLSRDQLYLAQERFRIGTGNRVDMARAQVSEGEDRIAIERQKASVRVAEVRLNQAMGQPPQQPLCIRPPQQLPQMPSHLLTEVTTGHARMGAAQAAVAVADKDVILAQGDHWPKLSANFFLMRQDSDFSQVYSNLGGNNIYGAGIKLSIPILDGFLTTSKVETQQAQARKRREELRVVKQELNAQLSLVVCSLASLKAISAIDAQNNQAAEESLNLARERYALGLGTALELRDAQLAATRVRLAAVKTHFDLQIALAAYHFVIGDLPAVYYVGTTQGAPQEVSVGSSP